MRGIASCVNALNAYVKTGMLSIVIALVLVKRFKSLDHGSE